MLILLLRTLPAGSVVYTHAPAGRGFVRGNSSLSTLRPGSLNTMRPSTFTAMRTNSRNTVRPTAAASTRPTR